MNEDKYYLQLLNNHLRDEEQNVELEERLKLEREDYEFDIREER